MLTTTAQALLVAATLVGSAPEVVEVPAVRETAPVGSAEDAADDPAIWVHPADPARSVVIGTDKQAGLAVYDLSGELLQFLPCGRVNNVDVRQSPDGAGHVVASNRTDDSIVVAVLDPSSRRLDIRWVIPTDLEEIYGICAALTPAEDGQDLHIIANDKSGRVQHRVWRRAGGVSSIVLAREFHVGSQPEGMVADETHGWLYVGEENAGVWRYPLDPGAAPERTLVDAVRPVGDHLTADVEGLTLVRHGDGSGYLVVSSQGSDRFVAYDRETGAHAFTFRVIGESGIDGVTETDGIDATARPLGPDFPRGLLVVQDDENPGAHQNFKYVSWADVLEAAGHVGRGAHEN